MLKTNKIVSLILAVVMVFSMFAVAASALSEGEVWTVAGADGLCGSMWDPADSSNQMTWNADKGIYEKVYEGVAAGTYEFKVVMGTSWGTEYNLQGDASMGGGNASVTVDVDGSTVTVGFDGTKALVEVAAPSAPVETTPAETTPAETTPAETETPAPAANEIIVNGVAYPVTVGETYTYTYCINVSDLTANTTKPGYIINMEASTFYDDSILEVQNYGLLDEDEEESDMFPILCSKGLVSNSIDDEITYNASSLKGMKFNSDESVLIKAVFKVIAEGSTEINTVIKNSQDMDMNILIEDAQFTGDAWKVTETLTGAFAPVETTPVETTPVETTPVETTPVETTPVETTPAEHTYTVAGAIAPGHVDAGVLGTGWDPTNTANDLTYDEATGVWSITYGNVPVTGETEDYDDTWYEYKVVEDHAWARSFTEEGEVFGEGTNAKFDVTVDGSEVTIFFDGTKCWAVVEYEEPATELVETTPVETTPVETTPVETTPVETTPEDEGLFVRVDGQLYPVTKGETYTYTYYMTVPTKVRAFDATTFYDTEGLDVAPAIDEFGDIDTTVIFPNIPDLISNVDGVDGEILYNFSILKGVNFTTEKVVMTVDFVVTADTGIYDITTQVKTMADTNMDKYVDDFETLIDTWNDREEFEGEPVPPVTTPVETTPVETTPVETTPVETTPVETTPVETTPVETQPEAPKTYIKTENGYYEVEKGQTYTYIFYLATDKKISSLDATTYYDTTGLKFIPAVDEDGEETLAEFPNFSPINNFGVEGEVIYNFSILKGVKFPVPADGVTYGDDNVVFAGKFEVIGEPGVYEINTALKVLGDTTNNKIVYNFEQVDAEAIVMTNGVIDGLEPVDYDPKPVETTPAETTPAETTPAETTPAETTPAETTPAETTPAETTPAETTPAETTPAETTPAETTPTEDGTEAPSAASPTTSASSDTGKTTNSSTVKTGSTEAAIAFITVLVMAAGVVMFARKKKFD